MLIRPASFDDLASINSIYNHYVPTSTTTYQEVESTMQERIAWFNGRDDRHVVTVAEREGEIVGWGCLNPFRARSGYRFTVEDSVYVRPDRQRCGIGSAILRDLIGRARQNGFHTMIAGIDAEQAASVALHSRLGFIECARLHEVGFKFNRWLDVIFMELKL